MLCCSRCGDSSEVGPARTSDSCLGSPRSGQGCGLIPWTLTAPSSLSPGTLTHRVPCVERGRRANHVPPSNDTSWSAHHPLWLKLKQIKPLPVIKHLRGSSPPSVASSPEKPAHLGPTPRPSLPAATVSASPQRNLGISPLVLDKQNTDKPQGPT